MKSTSPKPNKIVFDLWQKQILAMTRNHKQLTVMWSTYEVQVYTSSTYSPLCSRLNTYYWWSQARRWDDDNGGDDDYDDDDDVVNSKADAVDVLGAGDGDGGQWWIPDPRHNQICWR